MTERYKPLPAEFLTELGRCCGGGCSNCPFVPRHELFGTEVDLSWVRFSTDNPEATYEEYLATIKEG